jgi:hypothetical protein
MPYIIPVIYTAVNFSIASGIEIEPEDKTEVYDCWAKIKDKGSARSDRKEKEDPKGLGDGALRALEDR